MIDLGTYRLADKEHLDRALRIIELLDRHVRPLTLQQNIDDELVSVFQDPPIDLRITVIRGLDTALDCLGQIRRNLTGQAMTTPILLGVLLRSALLSSSRTLFMVGPADTDQRRNNQMTVLRQESDSLLRFYQHAQSLKAASGLVPPETIVVDQMARIETVRNATSHTTEKDMLSQMTDVVVEILRKSEFAQDLPDNEGMGILREMILLAFHSYSGISHGYAWPLWTPSTGSNLPRTFIGDLFIISTICQLAMQFSIQ